MDEVSALVSAAADRHAAGMAIRDQAGRSATWADMARGVAATAGWLRTEGVRRGDRVGLVLPNGQAFALAYWSVLRAGGVVVPVNPGYTVPEVAHIAADSGLVAMLAHPGLVPLAQAAAPGARVLAVGDPHAGHPIEDADGDAVAVVCYTSGTTGRPKGALLTHTNLIANLAACSGLPGLTLERDDVLLGVLPSFHVFGLNAILGAAAFHGAGVLALERFSPTGSLAAMAAAGVSVAFGAPPMFAAWLALPPSDVPALPRLRAAVSGADALPVSTFEGFRDHFGLAIMEGYGLTETSPVLTTNAVASAPRAGTVGWPVPGVQLRITDPAGAEVPAGAVGEVLASGPNVFAGYHGQPEATAEVLRDGWFATGDLGKLDEDEALVIAGRLKDMVIVSGFNVYPREVEAVLEAHPAVAGAVVVGVPDQRTGERVRAVVVARAGALLDTAELQAFCRDRLARYKIPREVQIVDELPRTALGKVQRGALRQP